jgi:L-cysteine/cystine lyase
MTGIDSERLHELREELNMPDDLIAVNAGSWGPLCRAAREAIKAGYAAEAGARGDDPEGMIEARGGLTRYSETIDPAKDALARFMNCTPREVALCDSSTTGMNVFLWGYDWNPGDEIIAGSLENPAAIVPLRVLSKRRRVNLILVDQRNGGVNSTKAIEDAITDKTKMILISDVNFATGSRVDLWEISRLAHESDVLVLVDGIQAVGTQPVDVKALGVDGYAMGRHKFLCGPDGAGALYVSEKALGKIDATYTGVFSDSEHGMAEELMLMDTAQRYEVSTRPLPVIEGGTACLEWIQEEVGIPNILEWNRKLYNDLWEMLDEIISIEMISQQDQRCLMTFFVEGVDPQKVVARLREKKIFTRTIALTRPQGIRLSIGFWNRESDLEAISEAVQEIASGS